MENTKLNNYIIYMKCMINTDILYVELKHMMYFDIRKITNSGYNFLLHRKEAVNNL